MQDAARKWRTSNYPTTGADLVELSIGYAGAALTNCGTFTLDELEFSGPPAKVVLKGIESWTRAPLRTAGSYAYEGMTFSQIAAAMAARHGWSVVGLVTTPDVPWQRRTQTLEHGGDIEFLRKLANEVNYEFNVRPPNIIFYSRAAIDSQDPSSTITEEMVTRYCFRDQTAAEITFQASTVSYLDPITKSVKTATAKASGRAPTADTLNIVERVENSQQAALKASSRLYEHDMLMYQGGHARAARDDGISGRQLRHPFVRRFCWPLGRARRAPDPCPRRRVHDRAAAPPGGPGVNDRTGGAPT